MDQYLPLEDYAAIGDSRVMALISRSGSLDWLCLPRFDSPSVFNRLLDHRRGGYFSIAPVAAHASHRSYDGPSPVLRTEFRTQEGVVRLLDGMPAVAEHEKRHSLWPLRSVVRVIEGVRGTMELAIIFRPRPDDGACVPTFHRRGRWGYFADLGDRLIHLATELTLAISQGEVSGTVTVRAGERIVLWCTYSEDAPAVYPPRACAYQVLEQTRAYWAGWAARCAYSGPYRDRIVRSALTLKMLSFAPSGAIVAAPTTSLPEELGGSRNWDYRYCWLRDAALTAQVFFKLGYRAEAESFMRWLMHATALTYPRLQVMYDLHGEAELPERHLGHLEGYAGSRPVRAGNEAHGQLQLDVYGHVLDALFLFVEAGNRLDRETIRRVKLMAEVILAEWEAPDHGMWEIAGRRQDYVHSKVMCWLALKRAEDIVRRVGAGADVERWGMVRRLIRETVLEKGVSKSTQSFVQRFDSDDLDALALTVLLVGFIPLDDPRARATIRGVQGALSHGDLLYRYLGDDGLPGKEGAFLACAFWLVQALALVGERGEAEDLFGRLEQRGNDLGLYSEEIDTKTGRFLGNFPQGLSHLAHIGAALSLYGTR